MYKKILVPLDGSKLAECVLPHVEALARGCQVQSVLFVRAVERFTDRGSAEYSFSAEEMERIKAEQKSAAEDYLKELADRSRYEGVNVAWEVVTGRAGDILPEYATKCGADLVVIATHGRSGVSRWVWGSVAERILRGSCVPVLMIRAPGCVAGV